MPGGKRNSYHYSAFTLGNSNDRNQKRLTSPPLCLENSDGVIQVWLRLLAHKGCELPELLWTLGNLRRGQLVPFNFGHLQATLSL